MEDTGPANADTTDTDGATATVDVETLLDRAGFDPDSSVLTRRQAEVLVLRERNVRQTTIADRIGTSRANVSSIEASARANIEKARETIAFVEALAAPVSVDVDVGTDLYDVPQLVYEACDDAGVKVNYTAPDLMKSVSDAAGDAIQGREVREAILVGVTGEGNVRVRRSTSD